MSTAKIDTASVAALFRERYSSSEDENKIFALSLSACLELESRIKENADCEDIRLLGLAAAMVNLVICRQNSLQDDDGITTFKAGDVSITISMEKLLENAEDELERTEKYALPLLKDEGFFFRQV